MDLEAIRKRYEESTEGEWIVDSTNGVDGWSGHYGVKVKSEEGRYGYEITPYQTDWEGYGYGMTTRDAVFVAEAHQDIPEMLNVFDALLALHSPETKYEMDLSTWSWVRDEEGNQVVEAILCSECSGDGELSVSYPCKTVRLIKGE